MQEQQEPRECQELPERRGPRDLQEPQEQQALLEQDRQALKDCKASAAHKEIQVFEGLKSLLRR